MLSIIGIGNHMRTTRLLTAALFAVSFSSAADIAFTGYYGQSLNQSLVTENGTKIDIKDDTNLGVSLDKHDGISKYGLYYSNMSSTQRNASDYELDLNYLLFQSAVVLPVSDGLSSYLGAQLGVNRISPNFSDSDTFFATGLYGGLEYEITKDFLALGEVRWLATILKNDSTTICEGGPDGTQCDWYFDGEVLNQFQFNLGVMYRF